MDFPQFSGSQRRDAVLHAERLQFSARVDAPRIGACFYQRRSGVHVLAEENRFADVLRETSIQVTPFVCRNASNCGLCALSFSLNSGEQSRSGLNPSLPLSFAQSVRPKW
jgi:hypothetical protein